MIDYTISEINYSPSFALIPMALFLFVSLFFYKSAVNESDSRIAVFLVFILSLIGSLVSFNSDFFSYQSAVKEYNSYFEYSEPIFVRISNLVKGNYLLFRIIVWGGALLLFSFTMKQFRLESVLPYYLLLVWYMYSFSSGRASLATALYFSGLSIALNTRTNRVFRYAIAALLCILSYSFHASAVFLIIMTIMVLVPINKRSLFLFVVITPLLLLLFKNLFFYFSMEDTLINDYLTDKLNTYKDREVDASNIMGKIQDALNYLSYYIPFIFISIKVLSDPDLENEKSISLLYRITFGLVALSAYFFVLSSSISDNVFTYRILHMAFVPIIIIFCDIYKKGKVKRGEFNLVLFLASLFQIWFHLSHTYRFII